MAFKTKAKLKQEMHEMYVKSKIFAKDFDTG